MFLEIVQLPVNVCMHCIMLHASSIPQYASSSTIKGTVLTLVDQLYAKTVKMILTRCLLVCYLLQCCFGQTVINEASGIYSTLLREKVMDCLYQQPLVLLNQLELSQPRFT